MYGKRERHHVTKSSPFIRGHAPPRKGPPDTIWEFATIAYPPTISYRGFDRHSLLTSLKVPDIFKLQRVQEVSLHTIIALGIGTTSVPCNIQSIPTDSARTITVPFARRICERARSPFLQAISAAAAAAARALRQSPSALPFAFGAYLHGAKKWQLW